MPLGPATRTIQTPFCFLDETGRINHPRDRFFGVGLLKIADPCDLQRAITSLRQRAQFYGEFKWADIRPSEFQLELAMIDAFFDDPGAFFAAFIADKQKHNVIARFGSHWKAYEALARQLLKGNIARNEVVTVLADEYSTPVTERFEHNLRDDINADFDRLAVSGVSRMRSTGHDCLQLVDLLLGAYAYDHKLHHGLVGSPNPGKVAVLHRVRDRIGTGSLVGGRRTPRVNLAVYKRGRIPSRWRRHGRTVDLLR